MKFRSVFKIAIMTSVILLCIGLAVSYYLKISTTEKAQDFNLYTLVPQSATVVIDTNNMVELLGQIDELDCSKDQHFLYLSHLFTQLKEHIHTLINETPHGFSRQMNKMLLSFHEPDNKLNQVFYCRLGAGDKELVERFVQKYCASFFPSKYFDYKGEEIRIYPMPDDSFLACYIHPEFLAVSYQKKLIEEVIDARLNKSSILNEPGFPGNTVNTIQQIPAKIYLRLNPLNMGKASDGLHPETSVGRWTEFTMKMNSHNLYFSGISYESDTVMTFMNMLRKQEQTQGFPGEFLPATTFSFDKRTISNIESTFDFTSSHRYVTATYSQYIEDRDRELMNFIDEYSRHSVTSCMFHVPDSISPTPCLVVNIPLNDVMLAEGFLKNLLRTVPIEKDREAPPATIINRTSSGTYMFMLLPRNTLLARITGVTESSLYSYICFYKGNMLVAPDSKSLATYIDFMDASDTLEGNPGYEESMVSLSESYSFMMMTDLGMMLEQPESYVRLVPNFFFRHSDFFKYFIISVQFTSVNDVVYPNVVLLYKGEELIDDSLLVPEEINSDSIPFINRNAD